MLLYFTAVVDHDHEVKVVSTRTGHCTVRIFPFVFPKCLGGCYFKTTQMFCFCLYIHPSEDLACGNHSWGSLIISLIPSILINGTFLKEELHDFTW